MIVILQRICLLLFLTLSSPWVMAGMADSPDNAESADAADTEEVVEKPKDIGLIMQSGNVEGFMDLQVGEDTVPATFLPEVLGEAYGKVLILHGENSSYASNGLVNMIRYSLPEMGWSTMTVALTYPPPETTIYLSVTSEAAESPEEEVPTDTLDLPATPEGEEAVAASEADMAPTDNTMEEKQEEADPNQVRIATALAHLHAQHAAGPTVIIAMDEAADLANTVIAQIGHQRALVWLDPTMNLTTVPAAHRILDMVPGLDKTAVAAGQLRRVQMKQYNVKQYSQQVLTTAGPDFVGLEKDVLKRIHAWLYRHYVKRDN